MRRLTSPRGWRPGQSSGGYSWHEGYDSGGIDELEVETLLPGRVIRIKREGERELSGYGNVVIVRTPTDLWPGGNIDVIYAHLRGILTEEGRDVAPGVLLGTEGATSDGRYPRMGRHLHLAARYYTDGEQREDAYYYRYANRDIPLVPLLMYLEREMAMDLLDNESGLPRGWIAGNAFTRERLLEPPDYPPGFNHRGKPTGHRQMPVYGAFPRPANYPFDLDSLEEPLPPPAEIEIEQEPTRREVVLTQPVSQQTPQPARQAELTPPSVEPVGRQRVESPFRLPDAMGMGPVVRTTYHSGNYSVSYEGPPSAEHRRPEGTDQVVMEHGEGEDEDIPSPWLTDEERQRPSSVVSDDEGASIPSPFDNQPEYVSTKGSGSAKGR